MTLSIPLSSLSAYSQFIAELVDRHSITNSTIIVWSDSPHTGVAEGEIMLKSGIRLRIREELDFEACLITAYGYEAYDGAERLYWYDDFPHPNDNSDRCVEACTKTEWQVHAFCLMSNHFHLVIENAALHQRRALTR